MSVYTQQMGLQLQFHLFPNQRTNNIAVPHQHAGRILSIHFGYFAWHIPVPQSFTIAQGFENSHKYNFLYLQILFSRCLALCLFPLAHPFLYCELVTVSHHRNKSQYIGQFGYDQNLLGTNRMFFSLSLRESTTHPGTIEPDVLPFSAPSITRHTSISQTSTTHLISPSPAPHRSFQEYIRDWDTSDSPALFRRTICFLAFFLHIPLNIISVLSYGLSLGLALGLVLSVLNLLCLAMALWKLDVMRGQRLFYYWIYKRHNFDYIILGVTLVYVAAFSVLLAMRLGLPHWAWYLRVIWPLVTVADIACFIFGWVSTWRDITLG